MFPAVSSLAQGSRLVVATFLFLALCLPLIGGCGWQLRGYQQSKSLNDKNIDQVQLSSRSENRLFLASLKRQLTDLGIEISAQAAVALSIGGETTERRPLSYSSTGIPVQYQLIMSVNYTINKATEKLSVEQRAIARRQYDFDTELVVAKNEEEKQLLQEMREELATKIIAKLNE